MVDPETTQPSPEVPAGHSGFDYCFWSKLLVAIILFPLLLVLSTFLFSNVIIQLAGGALAIAFVVYAAIKIDQMPCFAGKIPALIGKGAKR